MTLPITLRPKAAEDVSDVWDYTVEIWSADQADAYLHALDKVFRTLADFPDMARVRCEFTPPVRIHPFRNHVIFYVVTDDRLDIIRVVHSRANWAAFLSE